MENNTCKILISFPSGFGKFPYVIFKAGHAIYMQIPIHFNVKDEDIKNYLGSHVKNIDQELLDQYKLDKNSLLHDILIEHCKRIKNKIEADTQKPAKLCLVEGEEIAYFFDGDQINFNKSIPSGGTLITQSNKIIGIGIEHYC